jgi:hypothetical protein
LGERLAPRLGAVRMRSDIERKRLAGTGAADRFAGPLYGAEMNRRTYARLLECARACLAGGVDALVDAAFMRAEDRRLFTELAEEEGYRLIIFDCEADPALLAQRIEQRARDGSDPSDADTAVLARQLSSRETLSTKERAWAIRVETALPHADESALRDLSDRRASARC